MLTKELETIRKILFLLKGIHFRPIYITIPVLLSMGAAAFEGASVGLLIPMLQGFIEQDYSFLTQTPVLRDIIGLFPESFLSDSKSLFLALAVIFTVAIIGKNILRYFARLSIAYFAYRSMHHLRKNVFGRMVRFGKLYFDSASTGQLNTILTEFTTLALRPIAVIDKHVNALFSLVAYLVLMSFISWKLTLFALPLFFMLHVSISFIIRKIKALSHTIAAQGKELGKKSVEMLSNIPLIKAYSTERKEQDNYAVISDTKAKLDITAVKFQYLIEPFQELVTLTAILILFVCMLFLVESDGTTSASLFIVYFYAMQNAATKFRTVTRIRTMLANTSGPLDEVLTMFNDDEKYLIPQGKKQFNGLTKAITTKKLSFSYPDGKVVFSDLSVEFAKESVTAIVGSTGAGKTTLINLILRFYDCKKGTLFVDKTDIRDFSIPSLLRNIALVSQDTMLLHDSLRANIAYGLEDISDKQILDVVERARLKSFVDRCDKGLDTLIGDRGVKLSGGEKQRLAIARALLKDADILILDEATSALDSETEQLVQQAIDEAIKGRTAIIIAHRLSTIKNADKILVLENGTCVQQGTVDELTKEKGRFKELWEQQQF